MPYRAYKRTRTATGARGPPPQPRGGTRKAKAAALARYEGSVEQVVQLGDGSYVVHVITSAGEYHLSVSTDFKVTGAEQGRPGAGGAPASPPAGAAPQGGTGGGSASTS